MTLSTSLVAVWYSSDSVSSRCARLHLLEQPRVLDGDHRLVGEGLDQLDLLVGEGLRLSGRTDDDADRCSPPCSSGTRASCGICPCAWRLAVRVAPGLRGRRRSWTCGAGSLPRPTPSPTPGPRMPSAFAAEFSRRDSGGRVPASRQVIRRRPRAGRSCARFAARRARCAVSTMLSSTGCRSTWASALMTRAHRTGRRLILERLLQARACAACSSLNSRVFSMAMTAWSAKVCEERQLLVGQRTRLRGAPR